MSRAAVFLDRDGTVIEQVHHLVDPALVRLIDGAGEALRQLAKAGYALVVVTNQSVIGRGMLDEAGLDAVHEVMNRQLAEHGVELDGIYFSPHAPMQKDSRVIEHPDRKPGPGMLLRAAEELRLDLSRSWMIGDALTDMLAGRNAKVGRTILVLTGYGSRVAEGDMAVDHRVADLSEAADVILSSDRSVEPIEQEDQAR